MGGRTLSFGEVNSGANLIGHRLRAGGVGVGDRVVWWGPTTLEAVPLFAALAKIGAVFVPINSTLGVSEALPLLSKARPELLITVDDAAESALPLAEEAGGLRIAYLEGEGAGLDLRLETLPTTGDSQASPGRHDRGHPALTEAHPHVMFFTSGSTGEPKGAVLSHRASCLRTFPPNAPRGPGATICMFPLFHMASWTLALGCWQAREEVSLVLRADPEALLFAVSERRARRMYLIPAVWDRVLAELESHKGRWDLSSLAEADTGTSATPPELLSAIRRALPSAATRVMYGSTEAGAAASLAPEDLERKPGSVGQASFPVELRIAEGGEVCLRSELLMDGYFEDRAATEAVLRDGWYHTGDLGHLDDEGYLYIVGRARDVIRSGGESVSPLEVERVLGDLASVAEVAVVGVPDDRWGEVVCAVVVPEPGARLDLPSIRRACDGRLASFKHPRMLEVVESLPRTAATGQVQRSLILERLRMRPGR